MGQSYFLARMGEVKEIKGAVLSTKKGLIKAKGCLVVGVPQQHAHTYPMAPGNRSLARN